MVQGCARLRRDRPDRMCFNRENRSLLPASGIHSGWAARVAKSVYVSTGVIVASIDSEKLVLAFGESSSSEEGIVE